MEQLFEWIRNLIYYLMFLTVVINLLPSKKYEKYIRFFSGMVLMLLVLKPITGGLKMDDTIDRYFEAISLRKEVEEMTGEMGKLEVQRMNDMINTYEEAVSEDLKAMVSSFGFVCMKSRATINKDQSSESFGHVDRISLVLYSGEESIQAFNKMESIETVARVTDIKITASPVEKEETRKKEENLKVSGLIKKISEYYDLEDGDIEIQVEDGKG